MRIEIIIIGVTAFLIYNAYHDNKYTKLLMSWKKYIQIAFIGFIGFAIYLLLKKNPVQGKNILFYANNMIKYMPINKSSLDMLSPILDFSSNSSFSRGFTQGAGGSFMEGLNGETNPGFNFNTTLPQERRVMNSGGRAGQGGKATKRSVSETKKKFVASNQGWKCNHCKNQLNAWFEVDHVRRLEHGGDNSVGNLVALCRECHGEKTARENM
jgi:hypothetical protein